MSRICCWTLLCLAFVVNIAHAQTLKIHESVPEQGAAASVVYISNPLSANPPAATRNLVTQVQRQREQLISSLQQLQDAYCRAAMLDEALAVRDQIRRLQAEAVITLPAAPGTATTTGLTPGQLRGRSSEIHYLEVTGATSGTVWGSGPYTDDSSVATAAVHSGHLKSGETRVVAFRILPGRDSYSGSTSNGVTTLDYASWGGSYEILGAGTRVEDFQASRVPLDAEFATVFLTGRTSGHVWGDDIYTSDSNLATAAVHAGVLKAGESGLVQVEILAGQPSYPSATRHGVTSRTWGQWARSVRLRPVEFPNASPAVRLRFQLQR